jgi:hypothetical protein
MHPDLIAPRSFTVLFGPISVLMKLLIVPKVRGYDFVVEDALETEIKS